MVILYDKGMTTVIHPGNWSQHPFVSGVFFWDALYTRTRDSRERRFDYGYWNVFLLLGKVINAPNDDLSEADLEEKKKIAKRSKGIVLQWNKQTIFAGKWRATAPVMVSYTCLTL